MKKLKLILSLFCLLLSISACKKDEDKAPTTDNLNGLFIVNEGAFTSGNASISFMSTDSTFFSTDIFAAANGGIPLGDVAQSMNIHDGKAYIVVNNSSKIEVVSMKDFVRTGQILGIGSPRYFTGISATKGLVTDWNSNQLFMIDLNTLTKIDSAKCGNGPEQITIANNKIFVCNSGGFGDDSTITVLDLNTLDALSTIVTPLNPSNIQLDQDNNKAWVLCKGSLGSDFAPTPDDAPGAIIQINTSSNIIVKQFTMNYDEHPAKLTMDGNRQNMFYLNGLFGGGTIYKMSVNASSLPPSPFVNRSFYGVGVDPVSGQIYGGMEVYSANTYMLHYSENGVLLDSTLVGIAPNGFVFN